MRFFYHAVVATTFLCLVLPPAHVLAQSDAEIALRDARSAFAAEQYAETRDLLKIASQTDTDNPDIFLLLGKAHYQLGEVDAAIAAWRRTLAISPEQAFAKRMVEILQGNLLDADVKIKLVASLLAEQLPRLALFEITSLKGKSLSTSQLLKLLSLEAETRVDLGETDGALKVLRELAIRDPAQSATARTRLLTGKANIAMGGEAIAEGLTVLEEVKADFPDTPEGIAADLTLIVFKIDQGENALDELAAWIADHGEHSDIHEARETLFRAVSVYLDLASNLPRPAKELSASELNALEAAELALTSLQRSSAALELSQRIVSHLQNRLVDTGEYRRANEAFERLLNLDLPNASRLLIESALERSTSLAAAAELDGILVAVNEGEAPPEALVAWIQAHSQHPRAVQARLKLVSAYLFQTRRQGKPDRQSELSKSDLAAIDAAASVIDSLDTTAEKSQLIQELLAHLKSQYSDHLAFSAAIAGQQALLQHELPKTVQLSVLNALADTQARRAVTRLETAVASGNLDEGPLPADLVSLVKTFEMINQRFPAQPSWARQAAVGASISALSARIEWPATVDQIKTTDIWALEFLLPVVVANNDPATTDAAINVVNSIVESATRLTQTSARGLATRTHRKLLDALPEGHDLWPASAMRQLNLRVADDAAVFAENAGADQGHRNSELSDEHRSMLALASKLINRQPNMASAVLSELNPFLSRRSEAGYSDLVQQAYGLLESALPPPQLRRVRLAVAQLRVDQVFQQHDSQLGSGLQPAKELDEQLRIALLQCYQLRSDLEPGQEVARLAAALRSSVIAHYRNLGYFETAEAAIAVKAERAVDRLDAAAEFERASLRLSIALDELDRRTRQFKGRETLSVTPAIKEAVAGFEQFIQNRPADKLVSAAVNKIVSVARKFENYEKYDIAVQIYANLETFADDNAALQTSSPGELTVAQRAAHGIALAKHIKATRALSELMDRQHGGDPPAALSEDFQAAIAAYNAILAKHADSPVVSAVIGKIMEIALQHAQVGAWEIAEGVYADLQAQQLPLRQPERLDLARALCEVGKVMPEHARQLLAAITLWERATRTSSDAAPLIAMGVQGAAATHRPDITSALETDEAMPHASSSVDTVNESADAMSMDVAGDLFGGAMGFGEAGRSGMASESARAARESDLLAAVRRQQSAMATQIAMLRDNEIRHGDPTQQAPENNQVQQEAPQFVVPVLSNAEINRRQTILDVAYEKLQSIRDAHADTVTAGQAREQIMVIVNHWRSIRQWERAAKLVKQFISDNPTDIELPQLRHGIARDYLAWAAGAVKPDTPKQEMLDEVNTRFTLARDELSAIIAAFPENQSLKHQAQWDIATSHLSQARVVARFSSTLARGQFVRAANELLETADLYHDHPSIHEIPQMLANIAQELTSRRFFDEAITVWNEMMLHYPGNPLAEQAALQIAQTYQNQLRLPLRAVESYLELNFSRGGNDAELQNAIFRIATRLMNEKRWVESLHVLETFVDSFPAHDSAGQALTMIGQVHQANEIWEDAIAAYRRVILEYDQGNWAQESKWSIAECTINLSRWEEAQGAYREFQKAYPEDPRVAEAASRLEILKDLARFQKVVDEPGQRKAFDAQFQIGAIVHDKLSNQVKAIIEYRKVAQRWPESHLADDALFQVGMIYMELGQTENARDAFLATAETYPTSPLADDALFQVGASFENEAQMLAGVTRGQAVRIANELAQKQAYAVSQDNRRVQRMKTLDQITQLKKEGKRDEADKQTAFQAAINVAFDQANASVVANWAAQQEEALTTAQLADRQDKTNAALRKAVASFRRAASVASADKADDALLRMAQIYDQRLHDSEAAMATWLEIVKQYSGTTVAEDASWKIARYYESNEKYGDAIAAYNSFLRNYRRSPKASAAQAAIAENHEQLGNWVEAMDAYTNYINNYPQGEMASKAKEQIAWIKTYRL